MTSRNSWHCLLSHWKVDNLVKGFDSNHHRVVRNSEGIRCHLGVNERIVSYYDESMKRSYFNVGEI